MDLDSYEMHLRNVRNGENLKEANEPQSHRRYVRTISLHRNASVNGRSWLQYLDDSRQWTCNEECANDITDKMKQDHELIENSPESAQLRKDTLRNMPQYLVVKKLVKKKLESTGTLRTKPKSVGCLKRLKYFLSLKITLLLRTAWNLAYTFELWYSTLKTIEGNFGSSVGTYFRFLRWIFLLNSFCAMLIVGFVVVPQILFAHLEKISDPIEVQIFDVNGSIIIPESVRWKWNFAGIQSENVGSEFRLINLLNGEGFFSNSTLYYGFYTNRTINTFKNWTYDMPYAYFFTMFSVYVTVFGALSISMARLYRKSFIETQGGLKNVYANKILCGWDFSIATEEAAELQSLSICNELKELMSDIDKKCRKRSLLRQFWMKVIQLVVNLVIVILIAGIGYAIWQLLDWHQQNKKESGSSDGFADISLVTAFAINLIMALLPLFFTIIVKQEDYRKPRKALHVTLFRVFLLEVTVVGVLVSFWLTHAGTFKCWETSLGQEIYRLALFDFFFSVMITPLVLFTRHFIFKYITARVGVPEFDIARYTLQLIYSQTLVWLGLFFSPLLLVIMIIKLWFLWHARSICLMRFCKPCSKSWRPVQTHTWFVIFTFLSLLIVISAYGYIIINVGVSQCGPFRDYLYIHEMVTRDILNLEESSKIRKILMYLTKPGTVSLLLIALSVCVYYSRVKAIAQGERVAALRKMLTWEARDKEFLLNYIEEVSKIVLETQHNANNPFFDNEEDCQPENDDSSQ